MFGWEVLTDDLLEREGRNDTGRVDREGQVGYGGCEAYYQVYELFRKDRRVGCHDGARLRLGSEMRWKKSDGSCASSLQEFMAVVTSFALLSYTLHLW